MRVGDSYWLKDLNSTNGIQINGVLATQADLKDGDKIRFGSVKAVFAGCSRKRWSPCAFREFCTSSTTRPESEAAAGGDAEGKMQFNDSSKEKLGEIENDAMKRGMTHEAAIPRRDGAAQGYRRIICWPTYIRNRNGPGSDASLRNRFLGASHQRLEELGAITSCHDSRLR